MHRIILYVTGLLCLFLCKAFGQEPGSFESQTKTISENIEKIVSQEKEKLKVSTDSINLLVQRSELTSEQAEQIKQDLAQKSSDKINHLISEEETKLVNLVQNTVEEQITNPEVKENHQTVQNRTDAVTSFAIGWRGVRGDDGIEKDINGTYMNIGLMMKTRIFENHSLYYLKYGLTYNMQWVNLDKSNKYYVMNGNQTDYVEYPINIRRNSAFANSFLRIPVALEFDFSKKATIQGQDVYRRNRGMKFSLGGYLGYNTDSRQTLRYRENNRGISRTQRADWNVSDWEYGLMAMVSYQNIGFFVDYGLNPVFNNNSTDQRMISFGVIFE